MSSNNVNFFLRQAKKIAVLAVGVTALLIGIVLVFLPGPAFVFFFFGLLLLSTEFMVARRILKKVEKMIGKEEEKD